MTAQQLSALPKCELHKTSKLNEYNQFERLNYFRQSAYGLLKNYGFLYLFAESIKSNFKYLQQTVGHIYYLSAFYYNLEITN